MCIRDSYSPLINISLHLAKEYGKQAVLTKNTIEKYFDAEKCLPFIAKYQGEIIAYIIGIPLEELREEKWTITDENFGKGNTLYTYAFVIMEKYKSNGYAKMLKRVYISWAKKREHIKYVTGHVREGIANRFDNNIEIINHIKDWQGTGMPFEYYRRSLENELKDPSPYSPPVEITI